MFGLTKRLLNLLSKNLGVIADGAITKSLRSLEHTRNEWGPTLIRMEEEIRQLKAGAPATDYHSFYISRMPHHAEDFAKINNLPDLLPVFEQRARDREFHRLFDQAMACIAAGNPTASFADGDYYEFGCCSAMSFRIALSKAKKWGLESMQFHAFDSFEGLPTDGTLAISEADFLGAIREHGIFTDKVTTHPGFYDKTLTPELQAQFVKRGRIAKMVNVDCDLPESAIPVFKFIEPLIGPGTIIFIDDFWGTFTHSARFGTAKEFFDFCRLHPTLGFHPFARCGWWGMSFIAYERSAFPDMPVMAAPI